MALDRHHPFHKRFVVVLQSHEAFVVLRADLLEKQVDEVLLKAVQDIVGLVLAQVDLGMIVDIWKKSALEYYTVEM